MLFVANLVQAVNVLLVKVDLLEILLDAAGGDGLGDDGVAANLSPGEQNVGGGDLAALGGSQTLGDGLDLVVDDQEGGADGVVAKGRVGGKDDLLLGGVLDEGLVEETGVALDLVDGGHNTGGVDDSVELEEVSKSVQNGVRGGVLWATYMLRGKVGDTDSAGLGLGKLSHGLPGLCDGGLLVKLAGRAVGGILGEETIAVSEGDRPVDQVELCRLAARLNPASGGANIHQGSQGQAPQEYRRERRGRFRAGGCCSTA